MKTFRFTLFTIAVLLCSIAVSAHDFEVDGIYYNITSSEDLTVEVTYEGKSPNSYSNEYTGKVVIPESVTYEGNTYSVTSIGSQAFRGCSGLTSVTIGNSVTSIGNYAFSGCSGLTSITIPNSVTSIGNYAFSGCSGLTSVTIPNSVTSIGESAFSGCSGFTSITIPNSVTSIGWAVFRDCSGLTSIVVEEGNTVYDSRENSNAIIETNTNTLITGCQSTVISNSVTSIGESAFSSCSGLTSITIPNSVTSIGESAFSSCSGLTSVTIPNSVTSIGVSAFRGCSGLTSITIPNSVTSIGDYAFYNCDSLTSVTIPNSVTSIGSQAFSGCSGLTSVTIGNSVTSIGSQAFRGCSGLTSVTIGNSVTSIGVSAFRDCFCLTSITIPNSVMNIGDYAFRDCSGLTSVTIGNSVTNIGGSAFLNCSNLTNVHITDIEAWCKISFDGALSNPLYYAPHLYLNGEEIKDLIIPNSVTSIGNYAFSGCSGLTSVTIGNSVTSIGKSAFDGCSGLTSVHITDLESWCKIVFENNDGSNPLFYAHHLYLNGEEIKDLVIPEFVTSIGSRAFSGCSGLTSVTIGNSVTSIGNYAFNECENLSTVINYSTLGIKKGASSNGYVARYAKVVIDGNTNEKVGDFFFRTDDSGNHFLSAYIGKEETLTLPENYKDEGYGIDDYVFYNHNELVNVTIPNSVTSIGESAFSSCSGLTSVTIPNSVTSIRKSAFSGCSGLTSVTIPNSVTSIGYSTFSGCSGLTSVTIPNSVTIIGESAFSDCSGLTSVTIPNSVTSIGGLAFRGCSGLTSITIPYSVTSIGWAVFNNCSGLTSIVVEEGNTVYDSRENCNAIIETNTNTLITGFQSTVIPNSVTSIGNYAFSGCSGLTSVTIPYSVTSIRDCAFSECSGLTSVTIPNSVTSIGSRAFSGCSGLTSVTIPNSVTSIGYFAFSGCSKLTKLICNATTPPSCSSTAFDDIHKETCTLKVLKGCAEVYQAAEQWKDFLTVEEYEAKFLLTWKVDDEVVKSDSISYGEAVEAMEIPTKEGYTFSGWSEIPATMPAYDVTVEGTFIKVDGVEVVLTNKFVDVYTLQGVKIREQIPVESLENELPRGIYIVNGKKMVVR